MRCTKMQAWGQNKMAAHITLTNHVIAPYEYTDNYGGPSHKSRYVPAREYFVVWYKSPRICLAIADVYMYIEASFAHYM